MKNTMSKIDNVIQSKWCLTIIVLLLLSAKMMAQIPNSGFEDWTTVGNCEEPTSWYSTNLFDTTGSNYPSTKSTDHYPLAVGNYSVRLANNTALYKAGGISNQKYLGCGLIMTTKIDRIDRPSFPISGHPTSLCGYYKFLPQNGDTMTINILLFLNGTQVSRNHFMNSSTVSDWKSFNLVFKSYTNADSANIVLTSLSDVEVGPQGNSVLYVDNLSFDTPITSVSKDQTDGIPGKFGLNQNYPNPFNPSTTITFGIPVRSQVTLIIYDLLGKMIATLVNNETMSAGSYTKQWNAATLPSGVYFYRLQAESFTETKRLVLLK